MEMISKQYFLVLVVVAISGKATFSQTSNDDYILDIAKNCGIWKTSYLPSDSLTATWDGACSNNRATGKGTATYFISRKAAASYSGMMTNGYPNGPGEFLFKEGGRMSGHFENGYLNGYGKVVYSDTTKGLEGNFYKGAFLNLDPKYLDILQRVVMPITDTSAIYVSDHDRTELFYYALAPKNPKAVLVLLPGTWEEVEYVLSSNKTLCQLAYDNEIAVLVPSINQRLSLNEEVLSLMNTIFTNAIDRYQLPGNKFILGGFSMGGLFSLRYTELAYQQESKTVLQPVAVYSVDGPVDLENMYHSFEIALDRSPNKVEPAYALNEFKSYFGGSPDENRESYRYYSAFSYAEKNGGNAKYLSKIPVRIYNDVDVTWWLDNRNADLYSLNALDQSAMINVLRSNGNQEAAFINAYRKGFRLDGTRHPHSWSIVAAEELLQWLEKIIN